MILKTNIKAGAKRHNSYFTFKPSQKALFLAIVIKPDNPRK